MKGNEILPIKYNDFGIIPENMQEHISICDKPNNVEFIFIGNPSNNPEKILLFDKSLNIYEYNYVNRITKGTITLFEEK